MNSVSWIVMSYDLIQSDQKLDRCNLGLGSRLLAWDFSTFTIHTAAILQCTSICEPMRADKGLQASEGHPVPVPSSVNRIPSASCNATCLGTEVFGSACLLLAACCRHALLFLFVANPQCAINVPVAWPIHSIVIKTPNVHLGVIGFWVMALGGGGGWVVGFRGIWVMAFKGEWWVIGFKGGLRPWGSGGSG